jgi:hypothetical protein
MTARIVNRPAKFYQTPDVHSSPLTELKVGTEVELGRIKKKGGKTWVAVSLKDGQKGYLPGDTEIFQIRLVQLREAGVEIHSEPSASSPIQSTGDRTTRLYLTDLLSRQSKNWVEVRDMDGNVGYIDSQTRIKTLTEKTRALGKKNMLYGGLWFVGGITGMIILFTGKVTGGSIFFITLGVVLFGIITFVQGLYQYYTAAA